MAPSPEAVPMAARPATPAPITNTLKTMSAVAQRRAASGMISAPAARYVSSAKFAASPAPDCTATRKPSLISFSTTSGTVATRFSPAAVSRGTPISWGIDWAGILACRPASFLTSVNPCQPAEAPFDELERALHEERQRGGGDRAGKQRHVVVQREPRGNALAVAARADERGAGGGARADPRRRLDAGEDRRESERQLDEPEALSRPQAERHRRLPHAAADGDESRTPVANDRQQPGKKE